MYKVPSGEKVLVLKKLEEVTKCPICLSLLRPPLWYCVNGHCICMSCKGNLTVCPTCRGSNLQIEKNIILEDILNCLPRQCKFDGCDVFKVEQNLKLHESGCIFRKIPCRLGTCNWEGKADSLLDHIKNVHSASCNTFKEESLVSVLNFKIDVKRFDVSYAIAYNCIFWFYNKTDLTKGKYMVCFVCVPIAIGIVNNFYSTVIFSSKKHPDIKFQFTQKVCNEEIDIDSVFYSETYLGVPLPETPDFIDGGNLTYSYKIFRKS